MKNLKYVGILYGIFSVLGRLVSGLHLEEPRDGGKAEAELLEQGLVVGKTKLQSGPVERVQTRVGCGGDGVGALGVRLLPPEKLGDVKQLMCHLLYWGKPTFGLKVERKSSNRLQGCFSISPFQA